MKKTPNELAPSALWILVAIIWIVGTFNHHKLLHLFWWLILVLHAIRLGIDLWQPMLAYRDGHLWVKPHKSLIRRECLPISTIREVKETTREVGGVFRLIELPSFIFVTNEGREVEYFPASSSERRLNNARHFLEHIPNLPIIQKISRPK